MHVELSVARPLVEFAVVMTLIGLAGCLQSRDRHGWWLSHGLVAIGLLTGIAATEVLHPATNVMPLACWLVPALLLEGLSLWRGTLRTANRPEPEGH